MLFAIWKLDARAALHVPIQRIGGWQRGMAVHLRLSSSDLRKGIQRFERYDIKVKEFGLNGL